MHSLHFPIACSVQRARARPFKRSPFFLSPSLAPYTVSFHFLSGLFTPSLECAHFFFLLPPNPSSSISLPSCTLTVWFSLVHVNASVFLPLSPSPSLLSWVISLSHVCPSFYVCVPPLFVSDSFSREIRDAYLVLLSSTGTVMLSYTVWRWPHRQKSHLLITSSSYLDRCKGSGPD